jgi:hypothetical protein
MNSLFQGDNFPQLTALGITSIVSCFFGGIVQMDLCAAFLSSAVSLVKSKSYFMLL